MELKPGWKASELGPIPDRWQLLSLAELADSVPNAIVGGPFGSDLTSRDYQPIGVPVIRGSNMGRHHVAGDFAYVSRCKAKTLSANLARPGDVIFTQRGTLGQVSIVPNEPFTEYLISQSQMKISLDPRKANKEYISQVFKQSRYQELIAASAIQTGVPHLNLAILRRFVVACPPVQEQEAIALALRTVDDWITAAEATAEKQRALKAATADVLLTARARLPGYAGAWEAVTVSDLARVAQGGTPSTAVPAFWGGTIPWCTPTDITGRPGKFLSETDRTITDVGLAACAAVLLPPGTILLCTRATVGEAKIAAAPIAANQGFRPLIPKPTCDGLFLFYKLATMTEQMIERSSGSTFLELSGGELASLPLQVPSLAEQQAIAAVLSDMDAAVEAAEAVVAKARALKAGMVDALLSGRIGLHPAEADA